MKIISHTTSKDLRAGKEKVRYTKSKGITVESPRDSIQYFGILLLLLQILFNEIQVQTNLFQLNNFKHFVKAVLWMINKNTLADGHKNRFCLWIVGTINEFILFFHNFKICKFSYHQTLHLFDGFMAVSPH